MWLCYKLNPPAEQIPPPPHPQVCIRQNCQIPSPRPCATHRLSAPASRNQCGFVFSESLSTRKSTFCPSCFLQLLSTLELRVQLRNQAQFQLVFALTWQHWKMLADWSVHKPGSCLLTRWVGRGNSRRGLSLASTALSWGLSSVSRQRGGSCPSSPQELWQRATGGEGG